VKRGDVYWVAFDPALGGEIQKTRPAVIVSNDVANRLLNRVQVVPLTSSVGRVYPSEAMVDVNGVRHKAMADQIRTVTKARLSNYVGSVSDADLAAIETAIKRQLGLL
jgi:mRNA interferase MazF